MKKLKVEIVNFKTSVDYEYNLEQVIKIINNSPADFLLFPEVCLTGFDYENFKKANDFAKVAINELKKLNKAFALTLIEDNKNFFYFFDRGKIIHKRAKYNLFSNEKEYFEIGEKPDIFEWNNLKIANLICFELRFIEYWMEFRRVDIILVPARWGKERIEHFKTLNKAIALSTQSQIIACNSANEYAYGCSFDGWQSGIEVNSSTAITDIDLQINKKIRKKLSIF